MELPVYTLTIAKDGPKLKTVEPQPTTSGATSGGSIRIGGSRMEAKAIPLSQFISVLSQQLRRPVIDKTDLKGYYDIQMEFHELTVGPDGRNNGTPPSVDPGTPSIFTAIQEQLGLKLESTKVPVEVLVIDSVQRPSEN